MEGATIHHSASFVVALVDTVTGRAVARPDTMFYRILDQDRIALKPVQKEGGFFVFLNMKKIDFTLLVKARDYEPIEVNIRFDEIEETDPVVGVYLTPSNDNLMDSLITLTGREKGLTEISAVNLDEVLAHGERYDRRTRTIYTFEKQYRLTQNTSPFGILSQEQDSYDVVFIDRLPAVNEAKLKKPLDGDFVRNCGLIRIQYGQIMDGKGNFIFRVYDRPKPMRFLFRLVTESGITFKEIDFHNMEEEKKWHLQ